MLKKLAVDVSKIFLAKFELSMYLFPPDLFQLKILVSGKKKKNWT